MNVSLPFILLTRVKKRKIVRVLRLLNTLVTQRGWVLRCGTTTSQIRMTINGLTRLLQRKCVALVACSLSKIIPRAVIPFMMIRVVVMRMRTCICLRVKKLLMDRSVGNRNFRSRISATPILGKWFRHARIARHSLGRNTMIRRVSRIAALRRWTPLRQRVLGQFGRRIRLMRKLSTRWPLKLRT